METQSDELVRGRQWGLLGAVVAAVAASLCCVGPFVLLALGVSGAWIGQLTLFEPYRPLLMAVTLGLLGFAFYRVYRKPKAEVCEPGSYCANPRSDRINKTVLWVVTLLVLGLLAFPYWAPYLFAQGSISKEGSSASTVLVVQNMTCGVCPVTVRKSLLSLSGVYHVSVTLTPPEAVVVYDPSRVSVAALIEATTRAGYPSIEQEKGGDQDVCCM